MSIWSRRVFLAAIAVRWQVVLGGRREVAMSAVTCPTCGGL
jgi:hypothetical protein